MKAIVCVKQVPDTSGKVAVNPDGTLNRASMATIINPDDKNAVEAALKLKDATGCKVVVITMGPPPAQGMLRELMAMGADEGILVSAREFGGSDTFATSQILAAAIKKYGVDADDVVFCGRQAIDGDTAQVGPEMAEILGLPHVAYVKKIREVTESEVVCEREIETGVEVIRVKLPAVLTVLKDINVPRLPSYRMKMEGKEKETPVWGIADLGLQENQVGMEGSVTTVMKTFTPDPRGNCRMIEGSEEEMIGALLPVIEAVQ